MEEIESLKNKLTSFEKKLENGQLLSKADHLELREISLKIGKSLPKEKSFNELPKEIQEILERIANIRDGHFRLRTALYIEDLEKRWDEIDAEYKNPATSPERKEKLGEESKRISHSLQVLQR
jgi:hypothetical protein